MRYICWTSVSGYNLLKEAVTGHLLRRAVQGSVWRGIVVSESLLNQRRWIMKKKKKKVWESGAHAFQFNNITFYTVFLSWGFSPWFRNQILDAPPQIEFQTL